MTHMELRAKGEDKFTYYQIKGPDVATKLLGRFIDATVTQSVSSEEDGVLLFPGHVLSDAEFYTLKEELGLTVSKPQVHHPV